MPQLSTFATTASNVSVTASTRTITISNEVVDVDGVLDPPTGHSNWGGWDLICQNSGGIRFSSGASGTLGGGDIAPLTIIERTNGHRFGTDNWNSGTGNVGTNARFRGDGSNTIKIHNVRWIIEPGDRSDFDIARGNASGGSGSNGPKVEFSGLSLYQQTQAGQTAHFNHYSGQCIVTPHPRLGFGWFISNETNGHALQISTPIAGDGKIDGLAIDDLTATNNNTESGVASARVAVALNAVPANGELILSNLNTPNISDENGSSDKTLVLIDPVGLPAIGPNWGRHVNIEVRRTVPFEFTGVDVPANTPIYAEAQDTNGVDNTGSASGSSGSVVVRTQWCIPQVNNQPNLTWEDTNSYEFYSLGLNFQKYAVSTAVDIANDPETITGALVHDVFPNGDALTAMSTGTVSTIDQLYRALKTFGINNRLEPAADVSLVKLNDSGDIVMGSGATLAFSTIQSPLVVENNNLFTVKVSATGLIGPGKGINSLDLGSGNTADASVVSRMGVPYTDSTGTSSLVTINAPSNSRATVFASTGTQLGTATSFPYNLVLTAANSNAGTLVGFVGTDKLREPARVVLDLSSGGSYSHTFTAGRIVNDPLGTEILDGVTAKSNLTTTMSSTFGSNLGRATIDIPNSTCTVKEVLKSFFDALTTAAGGRFAATGRQLPSVTALGGQTANLFLGPDCQLRRSADDGGNESAVSGFVFGGIGGVPTDTANGGVAYVPAVDTGGGGGSLTAAQVWGYDLSSNQTADTAGDLLKDASTNSGGGGGGFTSTDRTNLGAIKTVTDALDVPNETEIATAVWGATTKEITGGAPSASSIADAVWVEDLSGTASAGTAAALIKNASTSGFDSTDRTNLGSIKTSVEGLPTDAAVATAVLNATLHEGQRAGVTFSPIAQAGDSFEVTTAIANQLRNGDRVNFTANGGYTVLGDPVNPSVEFYIYKAYDSIFIYQTSANALIGNSQYLRLGNSGTATNVSITRPPDSRYITIQTALDGLFSNTGSTIHGIDAVLDKLDDIPTDIWNVDLDPGTGGRQDIRSAIRNINGLLGTSFVETDIGVQEAFRIILAVLAGRSTVTGTESKTITFHRVSDDTAIVRGTASESGRTAPTIDPT